MFQKYRPIRADAHADDGVQPLELDEAPVRADGRKRRCGFAFSVTCSLSLLLLSAVVGYRVHKRGGAVEGDAEPHGPYSVFCYGDSLTYGMSPSGGPYPYAQYLEKELAQLDDSDQTVSPERPPTEVQHLGIPGWTARHMLDHAHDGKAGLCHFIETTPALALVVILAGTNDIGQMTHADKAVGRALVGTLVELHETARGCAEDAGRVPFRTLAVGIPGSAFQERVPAAAEMAAYVDDGLAAYAEESDGRRASYYAPFPFPYREDDGRVAVGDERWAADGLHLTRVGYAALAKELAPLVKTLLDGMEQA